MSQHETPLIRAYRKQVGGTLIEELPAVQRTHRTGPRCIGNVIFAGEETTIASASEVSPTGKDIACIQTNMGTLGVYLIGQAVFSSSFWKRGSSSETCVKLACV